jgi:hypothetical protein
MARSRKKAKDEELLSLPKPKHKFQSPGDITDRPEGVRANSRKAKMYDLFKKVGMRRKEDTVLTNLDCDKKTLGELLSDLKNPAYTRVPIRIHRDGEMLERVA